MLTVALTGVGTGIKAAALTKLLKAVQHVAWGGNGRDVLQTAAHDPAWRHLAALLAAGVLTGGGQMLMTQLFMTQLSSGNGIGIAAAIWFEAGRLRCARW